ncbi:hypothetical protein HFP72_00360 [Nocardiopsis sp. ARC36]
MQLGDHVPRSSSSPHTRMARARARVRHSRTPASRAGEVAENSSVSPARARSALASSRDRATCPSPHTTGTWSRKGEGKPVRGAAVAKEIRGSRR